MSFLLKPKQTKSITPQSDAKSVGESEATVVLTTGRALKLALSGTKSGKRSLRTRVVIPYSNSSAANAALSTVTGLTLSSSAEYSAFAALFDEYYVHGGVIHWKAFSGGTGATSGASGVMVYDPEDDAALTSVFDGLAHMQHSGPMALSLSSSAPTALNSAPIAQTPSGYWKMDFKCPPGTQSNKSLSVVSTGQWCSTADSTATCGYFKPYFQAFGASNTSTLTVYVVVDVTFRSRA